MKRTAAVAGQFYPEDPDVLNELVQGLLHDARQQIADIAQGSGCQAIICPHAGYVFSARIAALSFAAAKGAEVPGRVILAGPAHYEAFRGIAVPESTAFAVPGGIFPVDTDVAAQLTAKFSDVKALESVHVPEHSLEVMLPFIQQLWGERPILPLLCGSCDYELVYRVLEEVVRANDVLVISSDLSHFYPSSTAEQMDSAFLQAVGEGNIEQAALGEACGKLPILGSMLWARSHDLQARVLGYAHSGQVHTDQNRVVGYGSVVFCQGGLL